MIREGEAPPAAAPGATDEAPGPAAAASAPAEADAPTGPASRGTVKWYSLAKGYGFLLDEGGGADVFVHHSALKEAGEPEPLAEGERVEFQLEDTPRGRRARHVRRL